jgi:hypothetical protein
MKALLIAAAALALAGCSSLKGHFENRVAVTADLKEVVFVSKYGPVGISADVKQSDADAIIAGFRARVAAESASAAKP